MRFNQKSIIMWVLGLLVCIIILPCCIVGCNTKAEDYASENSTSENTILEITQKKSDEATSIIATQENNIQETSYPSNTQGEYIKEGSFSEIAGFEFVEKISFIQAIDVIEDVLLDVSSDELINGDLINMIDMMYFYESENGVVNGKDLIYQLSFSSGDIKYIIDIYNNEDGFSAGLNNVWETRGDEKVIDEILTVLNSYPKKSNIKDSNYLSNDEVYKHFGEVLKKSKDEIPIEITSGRYYLCSEQYRVEHWEDDFMEVNGYKEISLTSEQVSQLISQIYSKFNTISKSSLNIVDRKDVINTDFNVQVVFTGYKLNIKADDKVIYLSTEIGENNYIISINDKQLLSDFIKMLDENAEIFDLSTLPKMIILIFLRKFL